VFATVMFPMDPHIQSQYKCLLR